MSVRSLPHFSHKPIGKTTHKKGMSYAHINYIMREEACSKTLAGNMPDDRDGARPYFDAQAYKDGVAANARVADTLIIALPIELDAQQRWDAIAGFMDKIGHGRIAWLAAFHDIGKDEHNPHCHLIFRDADIETGRKVVGTTTSAKDVKEAQEKGWRVPPRMTTRDLRIAWCEHLNAEMERHGLEARFDHRRLKEQGIDREPGIHVGPKAMSMADKGRAFESQDRRRGDHATIYTLLDAGSRAEHNQRIAEDNRRREAERRNGPASPRPPGREGQDKRELRERQTVERRATYQEQALDRAALRAAHDAQKLEHQRWGRALYAEARERAFQDTKTQTADRWKEIRGVVDPAKREQAAVALKAQQKEIYATAAERQVGQVRPVKDEAWQSLKLAQETERNDLQRRHTEEIAALSRQHIAERYAVHERWQHQNAEKQAQKISARLEARQDMVTVQASAITMIKQRARPEQRRDGNGPSAPGNSLVAAQHFAERARAESATRGAIRYELNAQRQLHQIRAAEAGNVQRDAGGRALRGGGGSRASTKSPERAGRRPGSHSAVGYKSGHVHTMTRAKRAKTSDKVKGAISGKAKSDKSRHDASFDAFVASQRSGPGRNGGRSGR